MLGHRSAASRSHDDATPPWIVCGLGNPDAQYAATRHNVGYLVVDVLADRLGGRLKGHRATRALVLEGRIGVGANATRVVLVRSRTYMNDTGGPVAQVLRYYGAPPDRLVAVHDELDLPFATLRAKLGGGDNGHNGLRSIRRSIGTGDFGRVRFGIGRPPGRQDPADFVLRPFGAPERATLSLEVDRAADCVETFVLDGLAAAQNAYNG